MKKLYLILLVILASSITKAQDFEMNAQDYVNRYSISSAYAGFNKGAEAFVGIRNYMQGIDGGLKHYRADFNGSIADNMGYGFNVQRENSGNFKHSVIGLTYAFHIDLGNDMGLSFGISPKLINTGLDISKVKTQGSIDPVLDNQSSLSSTGFDAGFGLVFNAKGLFFSLETPRTICKDMMMGTAIYNYDRNFMANISYKIEASDFEIEPMAKVNYALKGGLDWGAGLMAKYKQRVWAGASYNSNSFIGVHVGGAVSQRICISYLYETGMADIIKAGFNTHEICLGFQAKQPKQRKQPTAFYVENNVDQKEEKKQQNLEKKLNEEIQKRDSEIKRLEEMIKNIKISQPTNTNTSSNTSPNTSSNTTPNTNNQAQNNTQEETVSIEDQIKEANEWESPVRLRNVVFGSMSDKLIASSYPELDRYIQIMQGSSKKVIKIMVFSSNSGSNNYDKTLTQKRAEAIQSYFVKNGINADRIVLSAQSNAMSNNNTAENRFNSNRIEVAFKKNK